MNLLASMRYLVALDQLRHFGRAAQACHITQPAFSKVLRALEQEFGVVIARRGRTAMHAHAAHLSRRQRLRLRVRAVQRTQPIPIPSLLGCGDGVPHHAQVLAMVP